jgi:hypothetical protein
MQRLNYLVMKLNMKRGVAASFEENQDYYEKVLDRVGKKPGS